MDTKPLQLRLAQTIGITTAAVAAGTLFSTSIFAIPRLLESPTPLLVRQWATTFHTLKRSVPPMAVITASAFAYVAYSLPKYAPKYVFNTYVSAAALAVGIVPYTIICIGPTNTKLFKKQEEMKSLAITDKVVEAGLGEETVHALVDWWGVLNLGRGLLLLSSAVSGAWVALQ